MSFAATLLTRSPPILLTDSRPVSIALIHFHFCCHSLGRKFLRQLEHFHDRDPFAPVAADDHH